MATTNMAPPETPQQPRKSWVRRHKVLTFLGVVAAFIVLVVALSSGGGGGSNVAPTDNGGSTVTKTEPKADAPEPTNNEPAMTTSQANAVQAARDYLAYTAFSKAGLIDQLSSKAGDGYAKADARFAVNHVKVNWFHQAVRSARGYLDYTSFSRSGLIDQLSSDGGEGFTRAQAEYAADKVGLK